MGHSTSEFVMELGLEPRCLSGPGLFLLHALLFLSRCLRLLTLEKEQFQDNLTKAEFGYGYNCQRVRAFSSLGRF